MELTTIIKATNSEAEAEQQGERYQTMTDYSLFYYPYASFNDAQLPLLKVVALWFNKLVILDPVSE